MWVQKSSGASTGVQSEWSLTLGERFISDPFFLSFALFLFIYFLRRQVLSPRMCNCRSVSRSGCGVTPLLDDSGKSAAADPPPNRCRCMTSTLDRSTERRRTRPGLNFKEPRLERRCGSNSFSITAL